MKEKEELLIRYAYLVSATAVGCKPEMQNYALGCCGFYSHEATTSWGEIIP